MRRVNVCLFLQDTLTRLYKFPTFNIFNFQFKKGCHVVTTEYRQAVECEARSPCIHDRNDIKSAVGTTEKKDSVAPTAL